ncbi:T9SS type B sorting domain-containing protein [uncultured Dokdonia sp.]|uniref:T9SS type B sorting domain-containing protein n=1 Tax=uncultured Dokdonia sp. TaxID=575653 RepID=UPI0026253E1F|nr:T9SS type B sorting domain-containing protein [uncultured Dokdonia sp.]
MKQLVAIIIFILISFHALAQRDAANWYFGNFAGLDFNSGVPAVIDDGALDTTEGCSAISDKDTGEILFYTEGTTIWNRNNDVMLNGTDLLGSLSSTQSAVIVPLPGSDSIFYVFTTDEVQAYQNTGMGNGINYSIVSMLGDGGLGEVIEKNTNLLVEGSEKISVVETDDGINYWIVTHFQDTFYAYLLDSTGVVNTPGVSPMISTIGPNIDDFENFRGAMKIAPNGSRLAISHCLFEPSLGGLAYLYDFDNATGVVDNQLLISDDLVYYGVEFSSDSSKLYFSGKTVNSQGESDRIIIEQYDLNEPSIVGSRYTVLDLENGLLSDLAGGLQIAMNRKIYHALPGINISVINNPKLVGPSVNFSENSVGLGFRSSSFGLPQYIQSFFESFITIDNICENDETVFTVDPNANVTAALWDFGDPASGADNTSTAINPTHSFTEAGLYTVTVTFEFSDRVPKTFVEFVQIIPLIDLPEAVVFTQCDIDGMDDGRSVFNLVDFANAEFETNNLLYRFYNSLEDAQLDQDPIVSPTTYLNDFNGEVVYLVIGDDQSCNNIIEVTLDVSVNPAGTNFTYELCDILLSKQDVWAALQNLGDVILENFSDGSTVEFYLTLDDVVVQVNQLTLGTVPHSLIALDFLSVYYIVSNSADCLAIGEVTFEILLGVEEENKDVNFCTSDGGLALVTDNEYASYQWSTGETTPSIIVDEAGSYNVAVESLEGCTGNIQFNVTETEIFDISIEVSDFQQYNSIIVTPSNTSIDLLYSIDGGVTSQTNGNFTGLVPKYYNLLVRDLEGCNAYNEIILIRGAPRYFTPNNDGTHDFWHVNEAVNYQGLEVTIFDRFGKLLYAMGHNDRGWDGTYGGVLMPTNAYWYRINYEGAEYYGHFTLIRR